MESADSSLVPGYRLDRYELLCPIASGGMASVWLARLRGKRGFEKLFAIKTIRTELISDPHFQEMFLDEARIASRIIHPHVAQILELGEQDDILYIVMEYVDGDSLAKINRLAAKKGSPLPPGVSMRLVADTCAGLHAAHQLKDTNGESLGVVHRDVSPQNILVTTAGTAKLIDFGLVKAKNRSSAETKSGVVKGKIRYMAPEQVTQQPIDHRADIWACGMCLYELITGETPYDDLDDMDVLKRLMSPNPLPEIKLALPEPIERVLRRSVAADPADRFESCSVMRRAIDAAIHELGLAAEPEHVAEFLKDILPELAARRGQTIAKAVDAAAERVSHVSSLEALGPGDMAFAQTEVSGRDRNVEDALPLTRKRRSSTAPPPTKREGRPTYDSDAGRAVSSYGRTTGGTTLTEQIEEQRKRSSLGYWVAALVILAAGGWVLWPRFVRPPDPPTASSQPPPSAAVAAPPPVDTNAPPPGSAEPTIELDAVNNNKPAPTPARPPVAASARPPASATASAAASSTTPGGLSPAALSAARIMLDKPPPEPPPPPPPAATSDASL